MKIIRSEMRGPALISLMACRLYVTVTPGQPLVLRRQPDNPVDTNALICCDAVGEPLGYVAREDAAYVSPEIDRGHLWRGKVTDPPKIRKSNIKVCTKILLWREEPGSKSEIMKYVKEDA